MLGIYSYQKFSSLDFPGRLCAILWFSGCNMRCPYCYNKDVVFGEKKIEKDEIIELQNDLARYSQTSWKTEKFEIFSKGGHWGTR